MPGTQADIECAEYILDKFDMFGLKNTLLEPVPIPVSFPDVWSLTTHVEGVDTSIPCGFVRYAAFTPPEGISAEMLYVGIGSPDDFAAADSASGVAGKIVVVDLFAPGIPMAALDIFDLYTYDPDNNLAGDKITENWPVANMPSAYNLAAGYGAAGFVGILTFTANDIHQYLHAYVDGQIPGVYISPNDGDELRSVLLSGTPAEATIVLTGYEGIGETFNVYGYLPGKSDETIIVYTQHDGWGCNEGSGVSVIMALAKYYAKIPRHQRERSLMFLMLASHFGKRPPLLDMCHEVAAIQDKIVAAVSVEMISKQYKIEGGEFVETGLISPRALFVSGLPGSGNPYLLDFAIDAVVENDLDRTSIQPAAGGLFPHAPGEGGLFDMIGIPIVHLIAHNAPQFTNMDTPDTVQKDALVPTVKALRDIIDDIDETPAALVKWDMTIEGRVIKSYPELREDVWELEVPPFGPYDRIGLRRVVKEGIEPHGVYFMLPGTWSNAEQLISNPPSDPRIKHENHSHALYLANRGWDVYALDYRTHFVDDHLALADLSFMVNWGWNEWLGDIKEAVNLAKAVSGDKRVYLAGDSFGGGAMSNYASVFWEEDLKGILPRDGGTTAKYHESVDNVYDLPTMIAGLTAANWTREVGGDGVIFLYRYANEDPTAPAVFPSWEPWHPWPSYYSGYPLPGATPGQTIFEWAAERIVYVTNIAEGFGDPVVMVGLLAGFDRYWPTRLSLDDAAIRDWDDCPFVATGLVPFDFDDHYNEIDVPLLGFSADSYYTGVSTFRHQIANPDFTGIMLPGYRHLDVYSGEFSVRDISEPTYQWLMSHRMLVGWGSLGTIRTFGWAREAAIYINATTIELRIGDLRSSWDIYVHQISTKHEFFKGENDSGKITVKISKKGYAIACGRNVFFIGYRV
jgi:hypothetical protein